MIRFILYIILLIVILKFTGWLLNDGIEEIQNKGLKTVVIQIWEGPDSTAVDSTKTVKE